MFQKCAPKVLEGVGVKITDEVFLKHLAPYRFQYITPPLPQVIKEASLFLASWTFKLVYSRLVSKWCGSKFDYYLYI